MIPTIRDLSACRLGGSHILQGIDFAVAAGGVTALLGRNGVGKTTTLKAILGWCRPPASSNSTASRIDGLPTHRIVRSGVGYVPEDREVFASLTVEENLQLAEVPGLTPDYDTVHELFPELLQRAGSGPAPCPVGSSRWWRWPGCCSARNAAAGRRADQGPGAEAGRRGRRRAGPGGRAGHGAAGGAEPAAGPPDAADAVVHRQRPGGLRAAPRPPARRRRSRTCVAARRRLRGAVARRSR